MDDRENTSLDAGLESLRIRLGRDKLCLYVDKRSQQWIVLDFDGNFWSVPAMENAWDHRQPYDINEESDLVPVPGHYKYMLGLTR